MAERKKYDYEDSRLKAQKFVRYKEGCKLYAMGMSKFQEIAKEAGAIYKINQMVLVNTEILDSYLEQFKVCLLYTSPSPRDRG